MAATTDKVELRGECPRDLAQALDALALARGMNRNAFVVAELEKVVKRELHAVSVIQRALAGNPLLSEFQPAFTEYDRMVAREPMFAYMH